jgi:hypothetical protein
MQMVTFSCMIFDRLNAWDCIYSLPHEVFRGVQRNYGRDSISFHFLVYFLSSFSSSLPFLIVLRRQEATRKMSSI